MRAWLLVFLFLITIVSAQDAAITMDAKSATRFNSTMEVLKTQVREKFNAVQNLAKSESSEQEFEELLRDVRGLKSEIAALEESWRVASIRDSEGGDDPYALWDVGE